MKDILTGKTQRHLVLDNESQLLIHQDMVHRLKILRAEAGRAGFSLQIASAFRGFEQQLSIWNAKALGLRTLYDDKGVPLDYKSLSPKDIVYAILRWSALPGASRHHWGTDIDVYDKSRIPLDYKVQLLPAESEPGGVFFEFHSWLDEHLKDFHFFRPYEEDLGGIAPEKWHISYYPRAHAYQEALTFEVIEETIQNVDIELKEVILEELPEIYRRFIDI